MATYTETASTSTPNWIAIASNDIDSQRHHYHYHHHHPENFGRLTKYILDDDNNNDKILSSSSSSSFGNIVGQQEQEKIDFSKHHYHTCNDNDKILSSSSSNITTTTILEPLTTTTTTTTTTTNIIPLNTKQQSSSSSSSILLNNLYQTNIDSDNHLSSTTKSTSTSCHYSTINDNKNPHQYQKNFCPGDDDDPKSLSLNNPHIFNLEKNILLNNNNNTVVDIDVITAATTTNTTTITIGNLETKTRNSCNSSTNNNNNNNNESRSCTSTNSKNYFKQQQHTSSSSTLSNLVSHIDDDKISSGENSKINDHHTAATFVKQQQQQNQNTEIKKYSNNNNNEIFATELVNHHNYDTNQLKTIKKLLKNHFDELSTSNCHLLNEKFQSKSKSKQQRKRKMTAHNNNNNNNAGVHYNEQRQSQQQHHHRKSSSTKSMIIIDDHNHHHIDDNDDYVRRNSRQNLHVNHWPNRRSTTTNQQFINNSSTSSNIRPNNTKLNLSKSKLSTTATIASNENKNLANIQSATTTTIGPITTMNLRNRTLKIAATATATEQHPLADISTSATCPQTTLPPTISDTIIKNFNDNESTGQQQQQQQQRRRSNRCQNKQAAKSIIDSSSSKSSDHQQQQQSSLPASSLSSSTTTTLNSSRSIRSFFPLRTIGSVCELFRSQLDPGQFNDNNDDDDNNDQSTNRNEPDLALLSIVLGIIETSLTRGLYVDHSETTTTSINNNENSMTTTLSDSHDQQQQSPSIMTDNVNGQRQNSTTTMNNGSYSPAEASIAPIVPIVSNIIHTPLDIPIPTVYYENVENLLKKFQQHIKESIDLDKFITDNVELINKPNNDSNSNQDSNHTTTTNRNNDLRELIKKISELIWSNLHRSHYKDRAHLQTIYSYVSENKLDCYGVAYTVLAACQILGLDDVRLVMSEDHAWVTFGQGETCEVTWHGKCGNDDRCGQSIPTTMESLNCWLYLNGNTMTCDRFQTIGTLVSAMNLSINATQDSEELAILQQHLLWILYDFGYLERYPMALGNLGDIEDVCSIHSTTARKHPLELFNEAIESARKYYNDYHVYPYTYLGGYYFRKRQFKQAFRAWADAARVVMKYNYTRDDEEIYKEFQEISNDLIPYIVKYSTSTAIAADGNDDTGNRIDSIIDDPECFVYLLQFYDGLCAWEEDSTTPVLHIGWTKPIVSTISKFPYRTRSQIIIKVDPTLNIKHQFNHQSSLIGDVDHHHYHSDDLIENSENHNINIVSGNQHLIGRERRRRRAASIGQQPATPPVMAIKQEINNNGDSNEIEMKPKSIEKMDHFSNGDDTENDDHHHNDGKIVAILVSKKFSGIKNLLTADKLNTSAIQLQLTAQSQVNIFNHGKRSSTGIGNTNRMFSTGKSSCGPFSEMDYILSSSTTTTNYGSKSTIANSPSSTCGGGQQIRTNQSSSNININQNSNNKRLRRE